jgi:hypothetical protein
MNEQATLQSIARSGHRKNFPLIRRAAVAHTCRKPFQACFRSAARLLCNPCGVRGARFFALVVALRMSPTRTFLAINTKMTFTVRTCFSELVKASLTIGGDPWICEATHRSGPMGFRVGRQRTDRSRRRAGRAASPLDDPPPGVEVAHLPILRLAA